jgi:hypothetical protein
MATFEATAADFWRLAEEARKRGLRVLHVPASDEYYVTSASDPTLLHRVTGLSCDCPGFLTWQRCTHHSLLLAELGWLPDPEPDPEPQEAATTPDRDRLRVLEPSPDPWDVATSPAPSAPLAFPIAEGRADGLAAAVEASVERLAAGLAAGHTEEFLGVLPFMSRFHRYSARNVLLILAQCPHASLVAGMKHWNSLGYRIRPGEKAIWILAPILRKQPDAFTGLEQEVVVGFRPAPVFDCSQLANLEERPLPSVEPVLPDDVEALYQLARTRIEATGIRIEETVDLPRGALGVSTGGLIGIRPGLDSRNRLFVLLHELAHELAHKSEAQQAKPVAQRELEAEAVSFVVAGVLGLENVGSRDYLLTYGISSEELRSSLGTIQSLVRQVLRVVQVEEQSEQLAA